MTEIVYGIRESSLSHAYTSKYKSVKSPMLKYKSGKKTNFESTRRSSLLNKSYGDKVRGTEAGTYRYGNYASPYYDPVARHDRYMRERSKLGIGKGIGKSKGGSGGSGGGKGGSGGSGGGKGGSGGGKGGSGNFSDVIAKLREESSLNTEAQREATKRKIADLKAELQRHMKTLSSIDEDNEQQINVADIRGKIQDLRNKIESAGGDLSSWITNEKDALERRIAAVYKAHGKSYKVTTVADKKRAAENRDKQVSSRADAIYKRKSR